MNKKKISEMSRLIRAASLLLASFAISPGTVHAQTINSGNQGNNAVWLDTTHINPSAAFIDASAFTQAGGDVCAKLNYLYTNSLIPATGAVIDARGVNSGGTQVCSVTPFPTTGPPATILLPSGTIQISSIWILPNQTRIVGEGQARTTIQALSGFSSTNMIQMAPTTGCPTTGCTGVAVEDLTLDGNGLAGIGGIVNSNAQSLSYVRRVTFFQIVAKGLVVSTGHAQDSGPYTDLQFVSGSLGSPGAGTVCAQVSGVATRGFHGLSCVSNGNASNAVLVDASNNTVEDVFVSGFKDAVVVGKNNSAQSDVIFNVSGSNANGAMNDVVHLCNPSAAAAPCTTSSGTVTDISIMGVTSSGATNSIRDDLTGAQLTDVSVGIYAVGEKVTSGTGTLTTLGYSRFTTSLNVPSWIVGSGSPTPNSCKTGALFSNTGGTNNTTWWVCVATAWMGITSM